MHTVFALLCFVVVIHWLIFPYPSGLLHWHCGNLTIAPVPAKQPWWIWTNTSCEFIMNDCITTTKQSPTKPCAYFLGYIVPAWKTFPACWLPYREGQWLNKHATICQNKVGMIAVQFWYILACYGKWFSQMLTRHELQSSAIITRSNFFTILHTALRWQWKMIDQTSNSQQTPHTSPSRASKGVSVVRILEKTDRIITVPHCTYLCIWYPLEAYPTLPMPDKWEYDWAVWAAWRHWSDSLSHTAPTPRMCTGYWRPLSAPAGDHRLGQRLPGPHIVPLQYKFDRELFIHFL